jgi:hypothetical protein
MFEWRGGELKAAETFGENVVVTVYPGRRLRRIERQMDGKPSVTG